MHLQEDGWSCGAISLSNALHLMGLDISVDDAKRIARTNRKMGTTRSGLIRGINNSGFRATPYHTRNPDNAWKWLRRHTPDSAIIALVDNQEHWVVFSKAIADKIILIDGSPNDGDNGVSVVDKQSALSRMSYSGHFYAIRVSKF